MTMRWAAVWMRCLRPEFPELYQVLAQRVISKLGLSCQSLHLDITSFHVDGQYAFGDDEESQRIQLVKGLQPGSPA